MQPYQFFKIYANIPLKDREIKLSNRKTLNQIYQKVHKLEEKVRPIHIKEDHLIKVAVNHWIKKGVF